MNWAQIANDLRAVRAENEISVALRRGSETVDAQDARIEYAGARGWRLQSDAAREARQVVFILGEPGMDIAIDDRLTFGSVLFRVVFIQPNRLAATIAEAVAIE